MCELTPQLTASRFTVVQFSSVAQSCPTLCDPVDCSTPGFFVHHQLLKLAQTHVHWVGDAIKPSHPLLSPSPPALSLSQHQGLFKWVLHIRWPKYWRFSLNISPSSECSGLISFSIDLWDILEVQGNLKSLLQHHSSKASILRHSAFCIVQLSHPYNYWKKHSFDKWTLVGKVISLLFNMLSRLVKAFLPKSKCLLISWLQSLSAVILKPRKISFHTLVISSFFLWSSGSSATSCIKAVGALGFLFLPLKIPNIWHTISNT